MRNHVATLIACLLLALPATVGFAADRYWDNAGLGGALWHHPLSWQGNTVPDSADTAVFTSGNPSVVIVAPTTVDFLYFFSDPFDHQPGAHFVLSGSTFTCDRVSMGINYGTGGRLEVSNGTMNVRAFDLEESSKLVLHSGAVLNCDIYDGTGFNGNGSSTTITLESGSVLTADDLRLYGDAWTQVNVLGGTLNTGDVTLSSSVPWATTPTTDIDSHIVVSGTGATWNSAGQITILGGMGTDVTNARLTVETGGKVISSGRLTNGAHGDVHLRSGGRIQASAVNFSPGAFTHTGGILVVDASAPASGTPQPGLFELGSTTLDIGGSGAPSPGIILGPGSWENGVLEANVGTSAGPGSLEVDSGNLSTTTARVGHSGPGAVAIHGVNGVWSNGGVFMIYNDGFVSVADGGELSTRDLNVVSSNDLDIQPGGRIYAETFDIADFSLDAGYLNVKDLVGGMTHTGGVLDVGAPIYATTISNNYTIWGGTVQLDLQGLVRGTSYDAIDVGGNLAINGGTLDVTASPALFQPAPGDRFDLFDAGALTGQFATVNLPALPTGQVWNVSKLYTTGEISVNHAPTVAAITPVTVECEDEQHSALLATTVGDADGQTLTVTWKVDGDVVKTENVAPGSQTSYGADYDHGAYAVTIEVNDGLQTTTAGTTVTVHDTANPIVGVAADVVVGTDSGEAFASNVALPPPTVSDVGNHECTLENDAPSTYSLGETIVTWTATDVAGNTATVQQKVIVEDREKPLIAGSSQAKFFCDPGKLYSTRKPPKPAVSDNVDDVSQLVVTSDAPSRFPVGKTRVTFSVTDGGGNTSTWSMDVTVVNRKPRANAGKNVVITTTSEKGAKVVLDGSASSDPDQHKLKYAWKAKRVKFSKKTTSKPSGVFPVGTTTVTLTVTDAGKLKHTKTMKVTVKLKNGTPRPRGSDANESFAYAAQYAGNAAASGTGGDAVLSGLAYANAASAYGDAAGDFLRWEEGQSDADALFSYAELRAIQQTYGEAAAQSLLSAYAETGDESLLSAYGYAAYGTAYAAADLSER